MKLTAERNSQDIIKIKEQDEKCKKLCRNQEEAFVPSLFI